MERETERNGERNREMERETEINGERNREMERETEKLIPCFPAAGVGEVGRRQRD